MMSASLALSSGYGGNSETRRLASEEVRRSSGSLGTPPDRSDMPSGAKGAVCYGFMLGLR